MNPKDDANEVVAGFFFTGVACCSIAAWWFFGFGWGVLVFGVACLALSAAAATLRKGSGSEGR